MWGITSARTTSGQLVGTCEKLAVQPWHAGYVQSMDVAYLYRVRLICSEIALDRSNSKQIKLCTLPEKLEDDMKRKRKVKSYLAHWQRDDPYAVRSDKWVATDSSRVTVGPV